jgi:hypothetical protein
MKYGAVSQIDYSVVKVYDVMSPSDIPPLPGPPFLVGPDDSMEVGWIYDPATGKCAAKGTVAVGPPVVTTAPYVGAPALAVGEVANCTMGTWENEPSLYTYLWLRDGAPIEGATGPDYSLAAADVGASISCQLTATNSAGSSAPSISNAIGPIEETAKKGHKAAESKTPEPAKAPEAPKAKAPDAPKAKA